VLIVLCSVQYCSTLHYAVLCLAIPDCVCNAEVAVRPPHSEEELLDFQEDNEGR
jgi:hypothetical protein